MYASATAPEGPWDTYNGWDLSAANGARCVDVMPLADDEKAMLSRIDHILVSRGIAVSSFATLADLQPRYGDHPEWPDQFPSDHFPITANLLFGNAPKQGELNVEVAAEPGVKLMRRRYVLTSGAGLANSDGINFRIAPSLGRAAVEDGEIVLYGNSQGLRISLR